MHSASSRADRPSPFSMRNMTTGLSVSLTTISAVPTFPLWSSRQCSECRRTGQSQTNSTLHSQMTSVCRRPGLHRTRRLFWPHVSSLLLRLCALAHPELRRVAAPSKQTCLEHRLLLLTFQDIGRGRRVVRTRLRHPLACTMTVALATPPISWPQRAGPGITT